VFSPWRKTTQNSRKSNERGSRKMSTEIRSICVAQ
jgi:hypothetical protein